MGTISTKGSGLLATKDSGITIVKGWEQTTMAMQIGMALVVVVGVPYMLDGLVGLVWVKLTFKGKKCLQPQRSYKNHLVCQRLTLKHNNGWQKRP
jgi:hypothetical protein